MDSNGNIILTNDTVTEALNSKLDIDTENRINNYYIQRIIAASPGWYRRHKLPTPNKTKITIHANTQVNIGNYGYISTKDVELELPDLTAKSSTAVQATVEDTTSTDAKGRAGKDLYIYACVDKDKEEHQEEPTFVISDNSTTPEGYDDTHSRKIGGFHCLCADVGTITNHPLSGYKAGEIIPNSVWDLLHRPISDPEGMVYVTNGLWFDIYLASWSGDTTSTTDGTSTNKGKLVSRFGGTTADGTSSPAFHGEKFVEEFGKIGKRLPSRDEFLVAAQGSNLLTPIEGAQDKTTTGGHNDNASNGSKRRMISDYGLEDCCGFLWQWVSDLYGAQNKTTNSTGGHIDPTSTNHYLDEYSWQTDGRGTYNSTVDTANSNGSSTGKKGDAYGAFARLLVGAYWDNSDHCGPRSVNLSNLSSCAGAAYGGRGCAGTRPIDF